MWSSAVVARHQIFLAHSSQDKPAVRKLKRTLERRGISVWYDEDLLPPGKLRSELPKVEAITPDANLTGTAPAGRSCTG